MSEPWFWRGQSAAARAMRAALAPAAFLYGAGQRLRWRMAAPADAGVPVICVGAAVIGGAGKTPFCLLLQRLLAAEGIDAHFLTRGYKGALQGPIIVNAQHTPDDAGDEALLLAAAAPTWVAKNRAAGARAAAKAGADVVIMDDGFQNPSVTKAVSFLLLTGEEARLARFPAGPLRETVQTAMTRAEAVVFSSLENGRLARPPGEAEPSVSRRDRVDGGRVREGSPVAREGGAAFAVLPQITPTIAPQPVAAFCGIARPERFFGGLEKAGFSLAAREAFADHHPFSEHEIDRLRARAKAESAALITTEKDFVRLSPADREGIAVARLRLEAEDPAALVRFVRERINR